MLSDNIAGINRVAELFVTLCDSTAVEVLSSRRSQKLPSEDYN